MATAAQKITLSSSRDIPFNKLVLSQSNVRRVKAGISVEELAESIARRGLIQSLHVRPVVDAEGKETGMFEVPAGGRRFRALELLVKQKRLAKIAPVPCVVSKASADVLIDEVWRGWRRRRWHLHRTWVPAPVFGGGGPSPARQAPEVSDRICNHPRAFGLFPNPRGRHARVSRPLWG